MNIKECANRRKNFRQKMKEDSVAIFFSAIPQVRNQDIFYPYRQDSNFYYLTGLEEENAILILNKEKETLYIEKRNSEKEIWDGPRLGIEGARQSLEIEDVKAHLNFDQDLEKILAGNQSFYYNFAFHHKRDEQILNHIKNLSQKKRMNKKAPQYLYRTDEILNKMRMYKSKGELSILKENVKITQAGFQSLLEKVRENMFEYEAEALLNYEFKRKNACHAYPPIVASGSQACILHYIKNEKKMKSQDLLLVDAGAEKSCLATDVTRTFPISSRFTPIQKDVYEIVLEAQKKAITAALPGSTLEKVHDSACQVLIQGLLFLKVLKGSIEENFEKAKEIEKKGNAKEIQKIPYKKYYMHKTSHWLGLDVHDVGEYYIEKEAVTLEESMVFTIEPGLYFSPKDTNIPKELRGLGIRIEDDIYLENKKALVLTKDIPKEVVEIESLRQNI